MKENDKNEYINADIPILGPVDANVFKLDPKLFLTTVRKKWWYMPLATLLAGLFMLCYLSIFKQKFWTARCMLFRHTNLELLHSEHPNIYKPISPKVIVEMVRTRKNMREVIKRLRLRMPLNMLYAGTGVLIDEEKENIITIAATASSPREAAAIANTMAEVFIEDYVSMQGGAVREIYNYYLQSQKITRDTLRRLEEQVQEYLSRYNVISISLEMENKFKLLNELEIQMLQVKMREMLSRRRIDHLNTNLESMARDIQVSYEVTTPESAELDTMNKEFYKLRQKYTDDNPRVQKMKAEIEFLMEKIKQQAGQEPTPTKIIYGSNQVRMALEEMKLKTFADMSGVDGNVRQLTEAIAKTREELNSLVRLENEYYNIQTRLQLTRDQSKKIDMMLTSLEFALKTNVSDISVMEAAEPPLTANVKRRRLTVMLTAAFFFMLALAYILIRELVSFTVKSAFDISNVMCIDSLGTLPAAYQVPIKTFHSAFQIVCKNILESIEAAPKPQLIAVGGVGEQTGKSFICDTFDEAMRPLDKRVLRITSCIREPFAREFAVNEMIYRGLPFDSRLAADNNHQLFFLLDEETFLIPADKELVRRFVAGALGDYDYVLWELFDFERNEQLFATICEASALAVMVARFRKTPKLEMLRCVRFLQDHQVPLAGIVNLTDKDYCEK